MREFLERTMEELKGFLKAYGAEAMYELFVYRSSAHFLTGSMVCGLLGCIIGSGWNWYLAAAGFLTGIFLPAGILYLSNERDNEAILKEMKWLYETITVQLQAGLHIHQALTESEGMIKNKRLKAALHRLVTRLLDGKNMTASLTEFENSFDNRYISSFCLILRQMQDSGYAVKLLEDIRLQIEEMEKMQLRKKKEALEMQLQVFQMLLFIGVLVLIIYGCIMAAVQNIQFL